ncbi:hypothetical protein SAMN05216359_105327 [Roseateles sp. YR242]|uniref:hypothetical protein n=1 Tax=Roseateles sp. YR242 TaxID=1855305 RepID=UPI0008B20D8B|nr:hypothetical protein [Roseateles sp. YR242]SEL13558.1 hypothetical protein SAMN05216359_105327 [Roseateles sp. YR242]
MTPTTIALLVSINTLISFLAVWVAVKAQRAPKGINGPILPADQAAPIGATFHDAALLVSTVGMLIHGETEGRDPAFIRRRSLAIADELTKARRAA